MIELRWLVKHQGHGIQDDVKVLQVRTVTKSQWFEGSIPHDSVEKSGWQDVPEVTEPEIRGDHENP